MQSLRPAGRHGAAPGTPSPLRFVVAPAYEVLFLLAAAPHPRRYELARGWGAAVQRRLSPQARLTWRTYFAGEGAIGVEPARLVDRLPVPASVEDLVALLRDLPPAELALAFLGDAALDPAVAEPVARVLVARPTAGGPPERALVAALGRLKPRPRAQVRHVLEDLEGARRAYTSLLLEAGQHVLAPQWPSLAPLLEATRDAYARRYAQVDRAAVVEELAGLQTAPPDVTGGPLVVALSYHLYPFTLLMKEAGAALLVVGTRGQETAQDPDPGTIRLLKALADATRLRILELIGERPRYVQELADVLDVRHPTVIHHLALLKQAGLVEATDDEGTTYYALQPIIFDEVVAHLRRRLRLS